MRLLIAAVAVLILAAPANAAEIHVNMKDDLLDPLDGKCSLREAIIMASFNGGTNGCELGERSDGRPRRQPAAATLITTA